MGKGSVFFDRTAAEFCGITDLIKLRLCEAYPGVSIDKELSRMKLWLMSDKGSKRKGTLNFIMSWLSKSKVTPQEVMSTPNQMMQQHLDELWKNQAYVLAVNKLSGIKKT